MDYGLVSENSGGIVAYFYSEEEAQRVVDMLNAQEGTCDDDYDVEYSGSRFWVMDLDEQNTKDFQESVQNNDLESFGDSPILNTGCIFRDNEEKGRLLAAIQPKYLNHLPFNLN